MIYTSVGYRFGRTEKEDHDSFGDAANWLKILRDEGEMHPMGIYVESENTFYPAISTYNDPEDFDRLFSKMGINPVIKEAINLEGYDQN